MALLGALAGMGWLPVEEDLLVRAMEERSRGRLREINRKAFDLGRADAIHRRR
jgi:Pyruvate/2-oxoacid:ferredoxin oxidoreductase gamma subunit